MFPPDRGPRYAAQVVAAWPNTNAGDQASFVQQLAQALVAVERQPDRAGVELLEGWLGLNDQWRADPEGLRRALGQLAFAGVSAKRQAEVVITLARLLRLAAGRGPAWTIALLGTWLGLATGGEADDLADHLDRLAPLGPEQQAGVVVVLADATHLLLGQEGRTSAARLLEAWGQLTLPLTEAGSEVGGWPTSPVRQLRPTNQAAFLLVLAGIWHDLDGRGPELASHLVEGWLGITSGDYADSPRMAAKVWKGLAAELHPDNRASLLLTLVRGLGQDPRQRQLQARQLLEAWLQLEPDDYREAKRLKEQLQASDLPRLAPSNQALVLEALADSLRFAVEGGERLGASVAETWLGLQVADYVNCPSLARALLRSPLEQNNSAGGLPLLTTLAECLGFLEDRGPAHAVLLMEAALGISPSDYYDGQSLAARFGQGRFAGLTPEERANAIRVLADALSWLPERGPRGAVAVAESWLGIRAQDYDSTEMIRTALERPPFALLSPLTQSAQLTMLANSLGQLDDRGPARVARLIGAWLGLEEGDLLLPGAPPRSSPSSTAGAPDARQSGRVTGPLHPSSRRVRRTGNRRRSSGSGKLARDAVNRLRHRATIPRAAPIDASQFCAKLAVSSRPLPPTNPPRERGVSGQRGHHPRAPQLPGAARLH